MTERFPPRRERAGNVQDAPISGAEAEGLLSLLDRLPRRARRSADVISIEEARK